jgi:hypothetical protein
VVSSSPFYEEGSCRSQTFADPTSSNQSNPMFHLERLQSSQERERAGLEEEEGRTPAPPLLSRTVSKPRMESKTRRTPRRRIIRHTRVCFQPFIPIFFFTIYSLGLFIIHRPLTLSVLNTVAEQVPSMMMSSVVACKKFFLAIYSLYYPF